MPRQTIGMAHRRQKCLQWHSVKVSCPPDDAVVLASSANCRVQAMRVGACAWSMQYHVEIEPDTADNWAAVPAYRTALEQSLGRNGLAVMKRQADANMRAFNTAARVLYDNFCGLVR